MHPLARGGYVTVGGRMLLLAPARAPLGPLTLRVPDPPALTGDEPVGWDGTRLTAGDWSARADAVPVAAVPPPPPCADGAAAAAAAARAAVAPPPPGLAEGIARLAAGDPAGAAAILAGLGPGLTPAGDDVLAGWAAWRVWDGVPDAAATVVAAASPRTTAVSAAYLACAARGELPECAHRVAEAIRRGDAATAARRARGLAVWGATSGAALLWGMAAACGHGGR